MSEPVVFTAPAAVSGVRTLSDGTIRLTVDVAKELPPIEVMILFEARKEGTGYFLFSPQEIKPEDVPQIAPAQGSKFTWSQKLRFALYTRWQNKTDHSQEFDDYYATAIRTMIQRVNED